MKVDPSPTFDVMAMVPPCASTSTLQMLSPKPVPRYILVGDMSSCRQQVAVSSQWHGQMQPSFSEWPPAVRIMSK